LVGGRVVARRAERCATTGAVVGLESADCGVGAPSTVRCVCIAEDLPTLSRCRARGEGTRPNAWISGRLREYRSCPTRRVSPTTDSTPFPDRRPTNGLLCRRESLPGHRDLQALLGADEVVEVLGGLGDVLAQRNSSPLLTTHGARAPKLGSELADQRSAGAEDRSRLGCGELTRGPVAFARWALSLFLARGTHQRVGRS
jgi:hypothetical protein